MEKYCPECGIKLLLKQISHAKAVYVCSDTNCKYPVNFKFTVTTREFTDKHNPEAEDAAIDQLIDEMFNNCYAEGSENVMPSKKSNIVMIVNSFDVQTDGTENNFAWDEPVTDSKWDGFQYISITINPGNNN